MNVRASLSPGRDVRAGVDRRSGMALVVSVGMHVLALLLWQQGPAPVSPMQPAARVVSIWLLPLTPPDATRPAPAADASAAAHARAAASSLSMTTTAPSPRHASTHAAVTGPTSPVTSPAAAANADRTANSAPASVAPGADTTVVAPSTAAASPTAAAPTSAAESSTSTLPTPAPGTGAAAGGLGVGIARHQAGRIDRELRGGKSGVPLQADTPWARFGRALEAAHIDRSMSVREDMYTAPDGVVYYRFRQGNQTRCRRSGGVSIGITGTSMGNLNDAGSTSCPQGATWQPLD